MHKKHRIFVSLFALWLSFLSTGKLHATETEHLGIRILPRPGKVVIDGKTGDWDLSGSILACGAGMPTRPAFSGSTAMIARIQCCPMCGAGTGSICWWCST